VSGIRGLHGLGPDPVAQTMFGSRPNSNDNNRNLYRAFRLYWVILFFSEEKFIVALTLCY
jgi:hypothetical protein